MDKPFSHILELGKRNAERRFSALMKELNVLIGSFPHLSDAFDADGLPVSFIIKRDARGTQVSVVSRQQSAPAAAPTVARRQMKKDGTGLRRGK